MFKESILQTTHNRNVYSVNPYLTKDRQDYPEFIHIDDLIKLNKISARTYKVCSFYNLLTVRDIIRFNNTNDSFKKLRNCGERTEKELLALCNGYRFFKAFDLSTIDYSEMHFHLKDLTVLSNVSEHTVTVCKESSLNTLNDVIDFYLKNKTFFALTNCDERVNKELQGLIMCNFYDLLKIGKFNRFGLIENFIKQKFNINICDYYYSFDKMYEQKNISIFKLIDIVLKESSFFDNFEKVICKNLYKNKGLKTKEIADIFGITVEGIRLKMLALSDKLFCSHRAVVKFILVLLHGHFNPHFVLEDSKKMISHKNVKKVYDTTILNFNNILLLQVLSHFNENAINDKKFNAFKEK